MTTHPMRGSHPSQEIEDAELAELTPVESQMGSVADEAMLLSDDQELDRDGDVDLTSSTIRGTPFPASTSAPTPSLTDDPVLSHSSRRRPRRDSPLTGPAAIPPSRKPRPIRTPSSPMASTIPHNNLPSAPASPPTPAPSPSPLRRVPDWSSANELEEVSHRDIRSAFQDATPAQRERILTELLNMCDSRLLHFVQDFVDPRLKKDPFTMFPNELCLKILAVVDHPRTLARASQVSQRWHELVNDDMAWKSMCEKHAYRGVANADEEEGESKMRPSSSMRTESPILSSSRRAFAAIRPRSVDPMPAFVHNSAPNLLTHGMASHENGEASSSTAIATAATPHSRPKHMSYRSHFKRRYMAETAWKSGGTVEARQITPDQGVVTSLHLTDKYIVVALDNAKIHVFDTTGQHQKTLTGHLMGVWAMVPWDDILVSGGCDREVRVWNMAPTAGDGAIHVLRGHTSTVRCLKMSDRHTAVTGSRDATLRIWDITKGYCKHILVGHQASVRCVEVHGDRIASGSYDTTAKIWSITDGRCLRTLQGHFSQIYAIAFDGRRVATGSLDTSVRIWNPNDGECLAVLQGHTSLVGQLQMRGDTLVTGGSDGSVRVWSLRHFSPIHRLAAHDNSVTSLQFNDSRIVSGGSDGRVKVWDLKTGQLVRELSQPAEAVWRVVFEEEKAIIMANRAQRTIMEVWSFSPPEDELAQLDFRSYSPSGINLHDTPTPSTGAPSPYGPLSTVEGGSAALSRSASAGANAHGNVRTGRMTPEAADVSDSRPVPDDVLMEDLTASSTDNHAAGPSTTPW